MNGYFQLIVGQGKTGLMLYPPTDGGEAIDSQELLQYLAVKQIPYDARAIGVALVGLSEPTEVTLNLESRFPEQEVFFCACESRQTDCNRKILSAVIGWQLYG